MQVGFTAGAALALATNSYRNPWSILGHGAAGTAAALVAHAATCPATTEQDKEMKNAADMRSKLALAAKRAKDSIDRMG